MKGRPTLLEARRIATQCASSDCCQSLHVCVHDFDVRPLTMWCIITSSQINMNRRRSCWGNWHTVGRGKDVAAAAQIMHDAGGLWSLEYAAFQEASYGRSFLSVHGDSKVLIEEHFMCLVWGECIVLSRTCSSNSYNNISTGVMCKVCSIYFTSLSQKG